MTARTTVKLLTGGKAKVARSSLFCITASAGAYGQAPEGGWMHTPIKDLPKDSLRVLGKWVGADGNLWVMLPDNSAQDITVVAPAKHYNAGEDVQKYHLYIAARTSTINTNLDLGSPEVCVGQLLELLPTWSPEVPGFQSIDTLWHLLGNYVNQEVDYATNCVTYVRNDDLLTNLVQQCWYVNGSGGGCGVQQTYSFPNGQTVNLGAMGDFTVYRPSVQFSNIPPCAVALSGSVLDLEFPQFKAMVTSTDFSGDLNWVQLIKRQAFGNGQWLDNTYGNYYLDNDLFYNTENNNQVGAPPQNTSVTPQTNGVINFGAVLDNAINVLLKGA